MSVLPRPASPRALLQDLKTLTGGDRRHKLVGAVVAVAITSLIVTLFIIESWWGILPEGQQITYVADWPASRTDAEIIAQQKIDQKARDAALAEKRRQFQRADAALARMGF